VAGFLGLGNIFEGVYIGKSEVETGFGVLTVACDHNHPMGEIVHLLARPLPSEDGASTLTGSVADVIFQQDRFKVTLDHGLYLYLQEAPKVGEKIDVRIKVECLA
jgi:hypothetical protein